MRLAGWRHSMAVERFRSVVALAALTGALTGLGVAVFDLVTSRLLFSAVRDSPEGVQVAAPLLALVGAAACLRWLARGASPSTADEYVNAFHDPGHRIGLRDFPGRLLASLATLGLGGAMGYEGPSIYMGAVIGESIQRRFQRIAAESGQVLLVAGAAAGVAAIFKAPATGAVFALEVPFQDDLARRRLIPALVGAATGYLAFVTINGPDRIFDVSAGAPLDLRDLAGAVLVGMLCGFGARGFAWLITMAKRLASTEHVAVRSFAGGVGLAALVVVSRAAFDGQPLSLGAGYEAIAWALDPKRALGLIVCLALVRMAATFATTAGGGVGGLFIPLVVEGAIAGRAVGGLLGAPEQTLFPIIGIAAFLGAGYRVPLAAVMFVAETTGQASFVVAALLAAVAAELVAGRSSVSAYQRPRPAGQLETRITLPVARIMTTTVPSIRADASAMEFHDRYVLGAKRMTAPVVDESGRYVGLITWRAISHLDPAERAATTVRDFARRDVPAAQLDWTVGQALTTMASTNTDLLAVKIIGDRVGGVITRDEIFRVDAILDDLDDPS